MWRIFKSRSIPPLCVRSLSCDFEEISSCRGLVKLVKLLYSDFGIGDGSRNQQSLRNKQNSDGTRQ